LCNFVICNLVISNPGPMEFQITKLPDYKITK
jgi:hypothetical protein